VAGFIQIGLNLYLKQIVLLQTLAKCKNLPIFPKKPDIVASFSLMNVITGEKTLDQPPLEKIIGLNTFN